MMFPLPGVRLPVLPASRADAATTACEIVATLVDALNDVVTPVIAGPGAVMTPAIAIPAPVTWELPPGLQAAAEGRRHARGWLTAWTPDAGDVIDDACLAVSELAANAAEHGAPPVTLTMSAQEYGTGARVIAVVHDASPDMPRVFDAGPDGERHRGLRIVRTLADS
jgi:anti-sigma regulatory factor (Ser/Thr protein kinase)